MAGILEKKASLTREQLDSFAAARSAGAVSRYFGFLITFPRGETVEVTLDPVRDEQRGGLGTSAVNGGVLAALFDFAVGYAATLAPPLRRSATVQLSMSFERPVRGNSVRCVAKIERQAKSLLFISAEIRDGEGTVCGRGNGIVSLGAEVDPDEWSRDLATRGT